MPTDTRGFTFAALPEHGIAMLQSGLALQAWGWQWGRDKPPKHGEGEEGNSMSADFEKDFKETKGFTLNTVTIPH